MNLAAIACSNGLGHIRRMVSISVFMLKNGYNGKIDAFMAKDHLYFLKNWPDCSFFLNHPKVKIFDFNYPKKKQSEELSFKNFNWRDLDLPDLKHYDVVWSDNILQVLNFRSDAIISGSFFWHEILSNYDDEKKINEFVKSERKILNKYNPIVVGNEYFATTDVSEKTKFVPVGLYRYSLVYREKLNKGILFSCGLGGEEEELYKEALLKIIKKNIVPEDYLFVEPRLIPKKYPSWIKKADFSSEMFNYCLAACIRPGMGTVSDALISRNRIFSFANYDSFEMNHNSSVIEKLRVGKRYEDPFDSYMAAIDYVKDISAINHQILRTSHLRADGVFATADQLLNTFKGGG